MSPGRTGDLWSGRWESNCIPNPKVLCFDGVAAPFSFKWSQVEPNSYFRLGAPRCLARRSGRVDLNHRPPGPEQKISPSCGRGFQLHHAKEKDIIFEMYMLVKVCFKFSESFVQCFEASTGVFGRRVLRTQNTNLPD